MVIDSNGVLLPGFLLLLFSPPACSVVLAPLCSSYFEGCIGELWGKSFSGVLPLSLVGKQGKEVLGLALSNFEPALGSCMGGKAG